MQWMQASDFCFAMAVLALLLLLAATAAGKLVVARFLKFFTSSRSDNQQVDHAYILMRVLLNYLAPAHTGCKGSLFVSLSLSLSLQIVSTCAITAPLAGTGARGQCLC